MNNLLEYVVNSYGGLKRWNELKTAKMTLDVGGLLWQSKAVPEFLGISTFTMDLHQQKFSYEPFLKPGQRSRFVTDRVSIENLDGTGLRELKNPRDSFAGHTMETPWDDLQLVYFSGYATWEYMTLPFLLTTPGFEVQEVPGRSENGEKWRALQVSFPNNLAYHSKMQTFYFGEDGLLRRLDYAVDIANGVKGAHYVYDHKEFDGIMVPTKRRVWPPDEKNDPIKDMLIVSVDLLNVQFS